LVSGRVVSDLGRRDRELGIVGLVGLPLLERRDDARGMRVVCVDEEVEAATGGERAKRGPSVPVSRAVDPHGDVVVVAIAALVELRVTVREASCHPDAGRDSSNTEKQYRKSDDVQASPVHFRFDLGFDCQFVPLEISWDGRAYLIWRNYLHEGARIPEPRQAFS
jgi:hypothetical protein